MHANFSEVRPAEAPSTRFFNRATSPNGTDFFEHLKRSQRSQPSPTHENNPTARASSRADHRLRQASKSMEAFFMKMLFNSMKKNVGSTGFLKGGFAEEVFDDFLTDEWAKQSVKQNHFQVASMVYNQLKSTPPQKSF